MPKYMHREMDTIFTYTAFTLQIIHISCFMSKNLYIVGQEQNIPKAIKLLACLISITIMRKASYWPWRKGRGGNVTF